MVQLQVRHVAALVLALPPLRYSRSASSVRFGSFSSQRISSTLAPGPRASSTRDTLARFLLVHLKVALARREVLGLVLRLRDVFVMICAVLELGRGSVPAAYRSLEHEDELTCSGSALALVDPPMAYS